MIGKGTIPLPPVHNAVEFLLQPIYSNSSKTLFCLPKAIEEHKITMQRSTRRIQPIVRLTMRSMFDSLLGVPRAFRTSLVSLPV